MRFAKKVIWSLIRFIASSGGLWSLYAYTLRKAFGMLEAARVEVENPKLKTGRREVESLARRLDTQLKVLSGPFKGLRYPTAQSYGSSFLPKVLGTYEMELHPTIERAILRSVDFIYDIGMAEGYYAVGLLRRLPHASCRCYDISKKARELCLEMAQLNDVESRIEISGACDAAKLCADKKNGASLLIVDCEGYEAELITSEVCRVFYDSILLIEVHDLDCPGLTQNLVKVLLPTHKVELIDSLADWERVIKIDHAELSGMSLHGRMIALSEGRAAKQFWIIAEPIS